MLVESMAVRYRPKKIEALVGQKHIQDILKGMQNSGKYPSSFLICGQFGSGKTTTARLISKIVNCENRNLCGECTSCKLVDHPDVIETNAGKDGKIDDIRTLIKQAKVAPMFRYRVVIIDEAHKLTDASVDALLVPTEETQSTIWILCTSEGHKIKPAMRSRFTILDIKPIDPICIAKRLFSIFKREVEYDNYGSIKGTMLNIAEESNGSMREAISTLEKFIYSFHSCKTEDQREELIDRFTSVVFLNGKDEANVDEACAYLLIYILEGDLGKALYVIQKSEARALITKLRYMLDSLIRHKTNAVIYTPQSTRAFFKYASVKIKKESDDISRLLDMQNKLIECELRINSAKVDECIALQCAISQHMKS